MRMALNGLDLVDNYVDDSLVHIMTWAEHLATLRLFFVRVRQASVTIKLMRCYLGYESLDFFVGHQIRKDEVHSQEDKINKECSQTGKILPRSGRLLPKVCR